MAEGSPDCWRLAQFMEASWEAEQGAEEQAQHSCRGGDPGGWCPLAPLPWGQQWLRGQWGGRGGLGLTAAVSGAAPLRLWGRGPSSLTWPCFAWAAPRRARSRGKRGYLGSPLHVAPSARAGSCLWGGTTSPTGHPALPVAGTIHGKGRLQGCTSLKREK